jgi:hypothetical protein
MFRVSVDVNDASRRDAFLYQGVAEALRPLRGDTRARWGAMTAQQMVEHLTWAFEVSTGRRVVRCPIPEAKRELWKRFLHDNQPMMREFRNPELVNGLPALRYDGIDPAVAALHLAAEEFRRQAAAAPDTRHLHPVFGPLTPEEWVRAHYKHCFHHLLQFGLVASDA